MPCQTLIYLGPAGCGKTHQIVHPYRTVLQHAGAVQRALWIAPTARGAEEVRQRLLSGGLVACLAPGVVTFDELSERILATSQMPRRLIGGASQRELVRRVVQQALDAGHLTHFKQAASRRGFIDLVVAHMGELQHHGISAKVYARTGGRGERAAEHGELGYLYAEYQRILEAHALYDSDGRHEAAANLLEDASCQILRELELVAVDGFTDFTHPQLELLRGLAKRTKTLLITLPYEGPVDGTPDQLEDSPRSDLFAKIAATLADLRDCFPRSEVRRLVGRPLPWPALDHVAQHIFRNPRQVPPLAADAVRSLEQLEIVEAASAQEEIVQIARRIKERLTFETQHGGDEQGDGFFAVRPGDIVVVFRSLAAAAPRIREVFGQFGIPYSLETGLPLGNTAILRTVLALLRLDDEDWPFRHVVAVLTNNLLTVLGDDARRAAEWLVRDLQVAQGRASLLEHVQQLASADTAAPGLGRHAERRVMAAQAAWPVFQTLAAALDALPKTATPAEWPPALYRLAAQLGISMPGDGASVRPAAQDTTAMLTAERNSTEVAAWHCLEKQFAALEQLDKSLGDWPRALTRRKLLDWLSDLAQHEMLPRAHDDAGRVRVLAASTARTISARHLYLAGMTEQSFPSPERAGRLSSNDDYRFFARGRDQLGVPAAPPVPTRSQEEMLLFYEVLTRAAESLTISYAALDERAQKLPPSPFVTELIRTLGPDGQQRLSHAGPQISPIPSADLTPCSLSQWRVQAVAQATGAEGDGRLLAGIFQSHQTRSLGAALEAGLRIVHARQGREAFGSAEGLLTSAAVVERLAARFGPEHLWSPTQWEQYATCPYKFLLEDVLGLAPLGDLVLETDYRRRGGLLHQVLANFHRQYGAATTDDWTALRRDRARFVAALKQTLQDAIDTAPRDGIDAALVELDRRQIERFANDYFDQHAHYDADWADFDQPLTPTYFEFRFGPPRAGDAGTVDPNSTEQAFPLDVGNETILVTGRIDRIDVGRAGGQTVFNVIDYKSGKKPNLKDEDILTGERLQLPLYVVAAQAVLLSDGQSVPLAAAHWTMKSGYDGRGALRIHQSTADSVQPTDRWSALEPKILAQVSRIVGGIRRGDFPVFNRDDKCTSTCDFRTICRVSQIRSLGKTWLAE